MTVFANDHVTAPGRRRLGRRLVAGVLLAVTSSAGLLVVTSTGASAGGGTKSAVVADEAGIALEALRTWDETRNPVDYIRFGQARDDAAATVEAEVDLLPGALQHAWSTVSLTKQEVLLNAISQLGVPYRSLASKPGVGFDCSGLTIWAFAQAGIDIPRVSRDQIRAAVDVDHDDAEAGDLVYYPGHISMYLGAEVMVHSPNTGSHVEIRRIPTSKSLQFGDAAPDVIFEPVEPASTDAKSDTSLGITPVTGPDTAAIADTLR